MDKLEKFLAMACHLRFWAALMEGQWVLSGARACCSEAVSSDQLGRVGAAGFVTPVGFPTGLVAGEPDGFVGN